MGPLSITLTLSDPHQARRDLRFWFFAHRFARIIPDLAYLEEDSSSWVKRGTLQMPCEWGSSVIRV